MRIPRHDFRRTADGWAGEHGEAVWTPRGNGDILSTLNGYAGTSSESFIYIAGIVVAENERWRNWKMGDPPLPRHSLMEYLQQLDVMTVSEIFAHGRDIDADWDVHHAMKLRHGT